MVQPTLEDHHHMFYIFQAYLTATVKNLDIQEVLPDMKMVDLKLATNVLRNIQ